MLDYVIYTELGYFLEMSHLVTMPHLAKGVIFHEDGPSCIEATSNEGHHIS